MRADPCPQFNWKEVIIDVDSEDCRCLSKDGVDRLV